MNLAKEVLTGDGRENIGDSLRKRGTLINGIDFLGLNLGLWECDLCRYFVWGGFRHHEFFLF